MCVWLGWFWWETLSACREGTQVEPVPTQRWLTFTYH
jgi:hypothetical protein